MRKPIATFLALTVIAGFAACSDDGEKKEVDSVWSGHSYEDAELTWEKGEIVELILYEDKSLKVTNVSYEDTEDESDDVETVSHGDYEIDGDVFEGVASTTYDGVEYEISFEGVIDSGTMNGSYEMTADGDFWDSGYFELEKE